jgi:hypothetical protein
VALRHYFEISNNNNNSDHETVDRRQGFDFILSVRLGVVLTGINAMLSLCYGHLIGDTTCFRGKKPWEIPSRPIHLILKPDSKGCTFLQPSFIELPVHRW